MTINDRIHALDSVINHLSAMEARLKASRMEATTMRDSLIRERGILIDHIVEDILDQPTPDDIAEFDYLRFDGITAAEAFLDHVSQIEFDIHEGADL